MNYSLEISIHSSQTLVALLLEFRLPTSSPAQPGPCYLKGHNLEPAVSTILLLNRQALEDCEQEGEIGACQFSGILIRFRTYPKHWLCRCEGTTRTWCPFQSQIVLTLRSGLPPVCIAVYQPKIELRSFFGLTPLGECTRFQQ